MLIDATFRLLPETYPFIQPSSKALFASISNRAQAARQDELEAYLEAPPLSTVDDPLEYWNLLLQTSQSALARMAIDFLSAQGKHQRHVTSAIYS